MRFAVLAILLASGCTSLEPTFYVDARFSSDEETEIAAGALAWETATRGAVHIDLVFGASAIGTRASRRREIVRFTPAEAAASEFATVRDLDGPGDLDGPAVRQPGADFDIIAIVPEWLDGWSLRTVVTHELGHRLGLRHLVERDALMSEKPVRAIERFAAEGCLSAADIRELLRVDVDTTRARECASVDAGEGVVSP